MLKFLSTLLLTSLRKVIIIAYFFHIHLYDLLLQLLLLQYILIITENICATNFIHDD